MQIIRNIEMLSPQLATSDIPASSNNHPQVEERLFTDLSLVYRSE